MLLLWCYSCDVVVLLLWLCWFYHIVDVIGPLFIVIVVGNVSKSYCWLSYVAVTSILRWLLCLPENCHSLCHLHPSPCGKTNWFFYIFVSVIIFIFGFIIIVIFIIIVVFIVVVFIVAINSFVKV